MPDRNNEQLKKRIAATLINTRNGRLALEIACWIHDLDKASWPFSLYGDDSCREKDYRHDRQPSRGNKAYSWVEDWLKGRAGADPGLIKNLFKFKDILEETLSNRKLLDLAYHDDGQKKDYILNAGNTATGSLSSFFEYHSIKNLEDLEKLPWETWFVSAALAGADGIDSEFFKVSFPQQRSGDEQSFPPKVATPFGYEKTAFGGSDELDEFKKRNQERFAKVWEKALKRLSDKKGEQFTEEEFCQSWRSLRNMLQDELSDALGYTSRPTNDVNLWAHSYNVGAMVKATAAALALDAVAAAASGKKLLFPLRTPEKNLAKEIKAEEYLLAAGLGAYERTGLERQVQTKFKVLSLLIRDTERLHVGRKIGDILGYHARRDKLFNLMAEIVEEKLALGSEIFRDHRGVHFLIPWCQDSTDAHLETFVETKKEIRIQELLQEMLFEIVECIFTGKEEPEWIRDSKIEIGESEKRKDRDFDYIVEINPNREPLMSSSGELNVTGAYQGLLFLSGKTSIDYNIDKNHPRRIENDDFNITISSKRSVQLCPVCRRRANVRTSLQDLDDDQPCKICRKRRESRLQRWWNEILFRKTQHHSSTIWAGEATDRHRRVTLLTIAFDLRRWFKGEAFDGYWMKNMPSKSGQKVLNYLPVYPAPARIQGVWEATSEYLAKVKYEISKSLEVRYRPVFQMSGKDIIIPIEDREGKFLTSKSGYGAIQGSWFIGRSEKRIWLLDLERFSDSADEMEKILNESRRSFEDSEESLVYIDHRGHEHKVLRKSDSNGFLEFIMPHNRDGKRFSEFLPFVEVLINSPTRFQLLIPGDRTASALETIHRLFLEHFGKIAHNIELSVNCLTFKEKFPFYLALEAADRFTNEELERRAKWKKRQCWMDADGLKVAISEDGEEIDGIFFEEGYKWECLQERYRDKYRSMVMQAEEPKQRDVSIFYGWKEEKELIRMQRNRYQPLMRGFEPDPDCPVFERTDNIEPMANKALQTACPRLSWAHLAAAGERYRPQLSIPLLSLNDWREAWEVLIEGSHGVDCSKCLEELKRKEKKFNIGDVIFPKAIRGMRGKPSRLRALIEEIVEAHTLWPKKPSLEGREDFIRKHIHTLFCHPNACEKAWDQWSKIQGCPLKILGNMPEQKGCMELASKIPRAIARLEAMASREGAIPLLTTFDLLYTLSRTDAAAQMISRQYGNYADFTAASRGGQA